MNINIELDLPGIIHQACAAERIQPIIDKAISNALMTAIEEATGYRSEFRKALAAQLATALPHGLGVDDVVKFQHVLNAAIKKHVEAANTATVDTAIHKILSNVLPDVPARVKLSDLLEMARGGFHKEEHEAFYAYWEPDAYDCGWLYMDQEERPGQSYGTRARDVKHSARYRLAVNKEGDVYALHMDGKDILPNSRPDVIERFGSTLMAMYVGRTRLDADIDADAVRRAAQAQNH